MTSIRTNPQSSIKKINAAVANLSDPSKLNRKISAVSAASFNMETNSVDGGVAFWQGSLSENSTKTEFFSSSKTTSNQEATQNNTVFAGVADIRIPSNIAECEKVIQTKLNAKQNCFGDDLFELIAWERKKEEPKTGFRNIKNYFIVDIFAGKGGAASNISFRALDKKKEEIWTVSDLVETFFTQYEQINTNLSSCKIPFISDKDPALVNQMKSIFSSKQSSEKKIEAFEKHLFTEDPVGKTVIRALARIGYQVVLGSLEWADDDRLSCYGQYFSAKLIPGETFLRFKISKTEKEV